MSYLLDTNIISEWVKPVPHPHVVAWLAQQSDAACFLSVITLSELQYGISRLDNGQRKTQLQHWLEHDLRARFASRILPVEEQAALRCGQFRALRQQQGAHLAMADGLIAASAAVHQLTLVTRNVKDFLHLPLTLINPFEWA